MTSRQKFTAFPMFFISHQFLANTTTQWRYNFAWQTGYTSQSRLDHQGSWIEGQTVVGGGVHPNPVYYQRLPSYFLRFSEQPDYEKYYWAQDRLKNFGQIDWKAMYDSNRLAPAAIYGWLNDVEQRQQASFSVQFEKRWSPTWRLTSEWVSQWNNTAFFGQPKSLLGASRIGNLDPYAASLAASYNNLRQTDPLQSKDQPLGYHYTMALQRHHWNTHLFYDHSGLSIFLAAQLGFQQNSREGHFKNGRFPSASYGKGPSQNYWSPHLKIGGRYALTGHHHLALRAGYQLHPPEIGSQYLNARVQGGFNPYATSEKIGSVEMNYRMTKEKLKVFFTGYAIFRRDGNRQAFYYADGIRGDASFFVQEHLNGVNRRHLGIEFAGTYHPAETVHFSWALGLGQFRYQNNPQLAQVTDNNTTAVAAGYTHGWQHFGCSYLKDYPLAVGPHQALSLGFHYTDPSYWRVAIFGNYFRKAYIGSNAFRRTQNFYSDSDGLPFVNYDPSLANKLLTPEVLPAYGTLNMIGGKSWKWGAKYFGFFISLQNFLNSVYKTGGFEQARNANYKTMVEDAQRKHPLFAPKYWWGRGTTFFTSIYLRLP